MEGLMISHNYQDPASGEFEVVERKGVGHPDSLADALANEVSIAYSKYCLENIGVIPHHNIDKLYIGAGHYKNDYGVCERLSPIIVRVNGRMSSVFGNVDLDIQQLQSSSIQNYLRHVMPSITSNDLIIETNASQHTKVPFWFTPRDLNDIPDATNPKANDTSVCIGHWPPTLTESLAYRLERYFWKDVSGYAVPRFAEIGQDIKVMVVRNGEHIEATLCVPTISLHTSSYKVYSELIKLYEENLQGLADEFLASSGLQSFVRINPYQKQYMLGLGSCIECGEEGVVGRGNNINGIISTHRIHTLESWAGKNPVYHTGRVYGYITAKFARAIAAKFSVKCTVIAVTRCGDSLFPPYQLKVSTDNIVNKYELENFVEQLISETDYIQEILSFRPWINDL
ncbi:MAG: methionine adenosyltransferase [Candidatus Gracilibacteria bacterium]